MDGGIVAVFATSFVVGLSGAASPGPLLAYTISRAARQGFLAGPLVSTGHALVELVVVIGLSVGLAALADVLQVRIGIGLIGGLVLAAMAISMLRGLPTASLAGHDQEVSPRFGPVIGGAVVTLSNPFWFIWWLTVGAALFLQFGAAGGIAGIVAFYLGHIASDYGWYSFVAGVVSAGRRVMNDAVYRGVLAVCAIVLLAMGAWFIVETLRLIVV